MSNWIRRNVKDVNGLVPIKAFLHDIEEVSLLIDDPLLSSVRKSFDGLYTVILHLEGRDIALALHDFKVSAGSYSYENSPRFVQFLDDIGERNIPLIYVISTMGVRIMEGRKVFEKAFRIIPALKSYVEKNLLITGSMGKCLGLGALLYSLGDYTLSLEKGADINLTGPEVIKMFFGENFDFSSIASAEVQQKQTMLVHEVHRSKDEMVKKAIALTSSSHLIKGKAYEQLQDNTKLTSIVLENIFDHKLDVFGQFGGAVKAFIGQKNNKPFALLINPLDEPKMLDVKTIKKYRMSLNFFKKLGLPLFSIVDTIGADPRKEENDKGLIQELTQLAAELIDYPYLKQGVVSGRCYGGASVLTIPPFFGGEKIIALKGSHVGIMSNGIIGQLLSSSSQLLEQWSLNRAEECQELTDMISSGVFSKVIEVSELSSLVESKLIHNNLLALDSFEYDESSLPLFSGQLMHLHKGENIKDIG